MHGQHHATRREMLGCARTDAIDEHAAVESRARASPCLGIRRRARADRSRRSGAYHSIRCVNGLWVSARLILPAAAVRRPAGFSLTDRPVWRTGRSMVRGRSVRASW
jgi:hypothetical protein